MITVTCKECHEKFEARKADRKRGRAQFCSISCSSSFNGRQRQLIKEPNVICATCNKAFYKSNSKRKNSKSGLFFCCRSCKDKAQRIGGIEAIQPDHYNTGTGRRSYADRAYRHYGKECNRCGYDENIAALQVHHRNHNRDDNSIENLEVLCANCHAIEHWS